MTYISHIGRHHQSWSSFLLDRTQLQRPPPFRSSLAGKKMKILALFFFFLGRGGDGCIITMSFFPILPKKEEEMFGLYGSWRAAACVYVLPVFTTYYRVCCSYCLAAAALVQPRLSRDPSIHVRRRSPLMTSRRTALDPIQFNYMSTYPAYAWI